MYFRGTPKFFASANQVRRRSCKAPRVASIVFGPRMTRLRLLTDPPSGPARVGWRRLRRFLERTVRSCPLINTPEIVANVLLVCFI